ncbi:phosphoglycerate dehydrogenase [Georgenia sp. 10Sc9-8]|uniref:Phosphoglycerate dehydrogenase n=1 Tax=Georgenia halotolerans TaxID=3028317 RepID=A0ABT5TV93_9MICO|nr:phosphoglycerate dehydrogenase [Georgenia halotolerans]
MKILLPEGTDLRPELPDGVEAVTVDARRPVPPEHHDAEAAVVWAHLPTALRSMARDLPRLRWVQSLSAGTDQLETAGFPDDVIITSGRGFHDRTVAEHALALTLAGLRRLPQMLRAQEERRWARELGGVAPLHPPGEITSLIEARVLVWGFGSIGQTLAPLLRSLGAEVRGVARTAGRRAGFDVVDEDHVADELTRTDVLIMVLPSTAATRHALDGRRLALLPDHAWVVNVGRGSTVDEAALVDALHEGTIGGAALDVTETEPLPADSPLWTAPNIIISPHAAGGRPIGASELISANLSALLAGQPLRNVVERRPS